MLVSVYMSKTNWLEIKEAYVTGNLSYKQLAKDFGVSYSTLEKRARSEKWKNEKRKHRENMAKKIEDTISDKTAQDYVDICEIARQELKELMQLNVNIRKNIDDTAQWSEKRVNTCVDNVAKIVEQLDKMRSPGENKEIKVVMTQSLKELSE